jgi:hypothetical protein
MKKNFRLPILAIILAFVSLIGCSSGPYTPKSEATKPEAKGLPIVFLDKDLRRTVSVDVPVATSPSPAGYLQVQVPFRNRTNDETIHLQVQTLFRNEAGMVLYAEPGSEPAWMSLVLTANQSAYYQQAALTKEAVRFTIRVRYQARPY